MGGGIDFWSLLLSILSSLVIVGSFLVFVGKRMIAEHAVSREEYAEDQDQVRAEFQEIRRFDGRLKGIEAKVDVLQATMAHSSKRSEEQLTGAMGHVRDRIDDLKDLIEARVGRKP